MLPLGQLIITQAGDLGIPNQREVCCYRRPFMKPLPIVNMSPADCNATKGNARSQISLSPFRVSKGRSLEPWSLGARSPKPFCTWSPDKNADSGQMDRSPRVQPWSPRAPVFLSWSSGALYFLPRSVEP